MQLPEDCDHLILSYPLTTGVILGGTRGTHSTLFKVGVLDPHFWKRHSHIVTYHFLALLHYSSPTQWRISVVKSGGGGQGQSGQAIKLFQITLNVNDFQTLSNPGSGQPLGASRN